MDIPALQPGDVLIVNTGGELTPKERIQIAADLNAAGVTNPVLVMQAETTYEVIRASSNPVP